MSVEYMLTTIDNPFNPFTDFDRWYGFDITQGHHTSEYIARLMVDSSLLTEEENFEEYNSVINSILENDVLGQYIRVSKENADELISKNLNRSEDFEDKVLRKDLEESK